MFEEPTLGQYPDLEKEAKQQADVAAQPGERPKLPDAVDVIYDDFEGEPKTVTLKISELTDDQLLEFSTEVPEFLQIYLERQMGQHPNQ